MRVTGKLSVLVMLAAAGLVFSVSQVLAQEANPRIVWEYSPATNPTEGVPSHAQIRKGTYVENKKSVRTTDKSVVVLGLTSNIGTTYQNRVHAVGLSPKGEVKWSATFEGSSVLAVTSIPDKTGDGLKDVMLIYYVHPNLTVNIVKILDAQNGADVFSTSTYQANFEGVIFDPIFGDFNQTDNDANELIIRTDSTMSTIRAID